MLVHTSDVNSPTSHQVGLCFLTNFYIMKIAFRFLMGGGMMLMAFMWFLLAQKNINNQL